MPKLTRVVKSFPIFRLVSYDNIVVKLYKRVKVSDFMKFFGINKTNRIVGWLPEYLGPTPSKPVSIKNFISEFLSSELSNIKKVVTPSCYNELFSSCSTQRVVYSRGYDTANSHLREYLKDNTTSEEFTPNTIIDILSYSNFKWFGSPVVNFNDGREIFHLLRTNLDAFAGHYTSKIFGQKKEKSDLPSKEVAYKLWDLMRSKPIKNFYLWSVLGREKDVKVNPGHDIRDVGTRIILTTENPATTLLMWFAQKISHVLMSPDSWDCTYNIGGEFNAVKTKKLIDRASEYDFILEADWRYYDSNQDTNFLLVASQILLSSLPNDRLHKNINYYITSSVITKYIALPPGVVIELNRAQPSGHPFGTLINCNVNLIYWSIIGYKIYGENYADFMHVEVYGDDTRAFFKNHDNLINLDRYIAEAGLQSDPVLPNLRSVRENADKEHQIDFLKRRFDLEGMTWNHKKMFDRWIFQSKNRSINEQVRLVCSYFESLPCDSDVEALSRLFVSWISKVHGDKLDEETIEFALNFETFAMQMKQRSREYRYGHEVDRYYETYLKEIAVMSFSLLVYKNELPSTLEYIPAEKYKYLLLSLAFPTEGEYYDALKIPQRGPPWIPTISKRLVSDFWKSVDNKFKWARGSKINSV